MEKRNCELTLVIGMKGTGKTTFTKQNIIARIKKKALIVDTYAGHPAYAEYPILPNESLDKLIPKWKSNTFLIAHSDPAQIFPTLNKSLTNCTLVLEDAKKYVTDSVGDELKRLIVDHKNKGIDVVLMFHSLSQVPKFIRMMYENIILFKTKDTASDIKSLYPTADVLETWHRVKNNPSKHYCEWISE